MRRMLPTLALAVCLIANIHAFADQPPPAASTQNSILDKSQAGYYSDPGIAVKFDSDPTQAVSQRRLEFASAVQDKYLLAFTHVSFPGVGHLRQDGERFVWLPLAYVDDALSR